MQKRKRRKAALAFSAFLFVLWWALGTGATLAWFSDRDEVRNEFQIGLLNLDVSYKNDNVAEYTPLQNSTKVFNDQALYEPGYTQVVYLKIENNGDVDFKYKLAITINEETHATNVLGGKFYLSDHLRYGVVFAETKDALKAQVTDRLTARDNAPLQPLATWSEISPYTFEVGENAHYAALIIYMPEEVGNIANYRGAVIPEIQLGISVFAQQANAPMPTD